MRDFKSRVTTLVLLSSFISPLSLVYSRAAVVGNRPLLANDWIGEQMVKIKEQSSLVDAFRRVEKLTGYRIMYSYDDVKNYKAQSMPSSKDIHKALSQVLGNLPLDFTINGKFVSISLKSATYRVSWEFTCKTTKILLLYIFLGHNRNVVNTKFPYPIKRLEVIRRFNQKSMAFNQSLS